MGSLPAGYAAEAPLQRQRGFTIVELMLTLLVMGVLATLAVPKMMDVAVRAKVAEACVVLRSIEKAQLAYIMETRDVGSVALLVSDDPTVPGYSKYFAYAEALVPGASSTLQATGLPGVGAPAGQKLWTEVKVDESIAHGNDAGLDRFVHNWRN